MAEGLSLWLDSIIITVFILDTFLFFSFLLVVRSKRLSTYVRAGWLAGWLAGYLSPAAKPTLAK